MPAPRQRALGFVIEGEGNYREPSTELHGRRPFNRAIARRRIHAKLFREILEEHLRLSISEAASRMGISRQSLHPGSPPQSRAVRWMRLSAVMISSTMPSVKYSCSGSPHIFANGNTAIDGLSGSGSADGASADGLLAAVSRTR